MSYRSYYLYQKYQSINGSTPMPVYPMEYSYDGEGTMQPVVKSENDVACGYVPPTEPMYQWVVVQGEYICEGYTKYEKMRRQVSYDGGFSWENLDEYTKGNFLQGNSPDCGYLPPSEPIYRWVGTGEYICTDDEPNYSEQYIGIESLEDNNAIIFFAPSSFPNLNKTISASTDGGNTWTAYTSSYNPTTGGTVIARLNTGERLLLKGLNSAYGGIEYRGENTYEVYSNFFEFSKRCKLQGNIMSLIYGDNFTGQTTLTEDYLFNMLFHGMVTDASNLILPATTLTEFCYMGMFQTCTYLTAAPALPATTLTRGCYRDMFWQCTSLTTAPVLPATTLAIACYGDMFQYCSSLNSITCLATNISASGCTGNWVDGVAASGTFKKAASMTGWGTGTSGIPTGWTVQNA